MRQLVLDLQGNGGGYLNVAVAIADMFLEKDQLIVYTEGRNVRRAQEKATGKPLLPDEQVVVMVDELSASASEILAGALQDWDRAVVVGRRTFGKGLVQRPITLPDQSLLAPYRCRYHTPTGRCIQRPYVKGESEAYDQDLNERLVHGELLHADSIHFADSLTYKTLRRGRTVYGGGGIMPDVFVALDTTRYTAYQRNLVRSGALNRSIYTYLDSQRKELTSRYRKASRFAEQYEVDSLLWSILDARAAEAGVVPKSEKEKEESRPLIATQLKALLARRPLQRQLAVLPHLQSDRSHLPQSHRNHRAPTIIVTFGRITRHKKSREGVALDGADPLYFFESVKRFILLYRPIRLRL